MTEPVLLPKPDARKHQQMKILKSGYVLWITESHWDNKKHMTVDNRRSIGKLVSIDETSPRQIFPNAEYFRIFGSSNDAGLPQVDAEVTLQPFPGRCDTTLSYGAFAVLEASARATGCLDALNHAFPMLSLKILAVAYHSIIAGDSTAQDFPFWAFHNYCGIPRIPDGTEIGRLYVDIARNKGKISLFQKTFNKEYAKKLGLPEDVVVALDSTNQNTHSGNIGLAGYGHAKIKEDLPCINTALFADEGTGIPLSYEHFSGALLDKTQTPYTVAKARTLGFCKLFFMMDRGYCAPKCLKAFEDMKFGVMVPETYSFVDRLIEEHAKEIINNENYYLDNEQIYGIHLPGQQVMGGTYDAYLYFDDNRAQEERNAIHSKVAFLATEASRRKRYSTKLKEQYSPWLTIVNEKDKDADRNFRLLKNQQKIQEELDKAGLFVILSNAGYSAGKMITVARMRDKDEKAFRTLKSHFDLTKTYVHSDEAYEGKMFVAFVALIIIESFRWLARAELSRSTSTSLASLLGEMSKYTILLDENNKWMPKYALTKKQKDILACVQKDEQQIEAAVEKLAIRP